MADLLCGDITDKVLKVYYTVYNRFVEDKIAGEYYADIIVENKVILELKAAEGLIEEHE